MNLKQLQYFRVLAQTEHYTRAAEKLYITQPSLSYSISELEREFGTQLFEKEGRNVKLTKYGRFFLSYVEKALDELDLGKNLLLKMVSPTEGKVDLAFIYTLGSKFVPNIVQSFLNETNYKNVEFSFAQGNTQYLINNLKQGKFDLVFCSFVENEPNIDFIPIAQEELVIIVPKDHPLSNYKSVSLNETAPYPFVFFSNESGLRPLIDKMFKDSNIVPKIACEAEEDSAIAGFVAINYGIAIIPNIPSLKNFDVKIIKIKQPNYKRFIYAATVKDRYNTLATDSFRSFAIKYGKKNYLDVNKCI
ncbi:LysR family transcriptional regulator [Clostridium carboxidivorans P7]|uniref:LysR family transcriptional regulator n=1 Tax=Clostridium carboxidivorans TaxID=217159 RepID=UPI000313F528|nr:LysR family transcriptional regulator [Clostridium carboxidivorans]AKN30485.1 LysR family transcriptional regulator [Clostridium carboxidivorans P7]